MTIVYIYTITLIITQILHITVLQQSSQLWRNTFPSWQGETVRIRTVKSLPRSLYKWMSFHHPLHLDGMNWKLWRHTAGSAPQSPAWHLTLHTQLLSTAALPNVTAPRTTIRPLSITQKARLNQLDTGTNPPILDHLRQHSLRMPCRHHVTTHPTLDTNTPPHDEDRRRPRTSPQKDVALVSCA